MKIPQHLLRSLALGLGAISITALSGCKATASPAPLPGPCIDRCQPAQPTSAVPPSAPGTCEVIEVAPPAPLEPDPIDSCPACGRG